MLLFLKNLLVICIVGRLRIITSVYQYNDISYSTKGVESHVAYHYNLLSGKTTDTIMYAVKYSEAIRQHYDFRNQKIKRRLKQVRFLFNELEFEVMEKLCETQIVTC